MKTPLYNTAHPLAESGKPIFIPFGEWNYDGQSRQRLDRAHGEKIANELNARVAKGDPGIPVYQGHPDVPALASKYPDKGALGWVVRAELANEDGKDGLALTVEWDRDPGRGFRWFSPYWLANGREGSTYVVDSIASIGLVNNPNIPEFRLANEAEVNANKETKMELDIEELLKLFGLPPEASAEDLMKAIRLAHDAQTAKDAADERARQAEADRRDAAEDAAEARRDLENEKKAHAATQTALANERGAMADMALDAAVREKRIGETARKTWKERLLKDGAAGYAALANEKPLPGADRTRGLVNEAGQTDSERRMALVNEIMKSESCGYDDAWQRAARRNPELFK